MAHHNESLDDSDNTTNDSFMDNEQLLVGNNCNQNKKNQLPVVTLDVHKGAMIRLQVKVVVPCEDHPNYNFVGKLLGPKGNSLKWLQERTKTKMAILGRGSMRNKQKEEELRQSKHPNFLHLNESLHVEITAIATAPEAYLRISNALFEIKRFLVPDYFDEIRQQQLRELGVITNGDVIGNDPPLMEERIPIVVEKNKDNNNNGIHYYTATSQDFGCSQPPPNGSLFSMKTYGCSDIVHRKSGSKSRSMGHGKSYLVNRTKPYHRPVSF